MGVQVAPSGLPSVQQVLGTRAVPWDGPLTPDFVKGVVETHRGEATRAHHSRQRASHGTSSLLRGLPRHNPRLHAMPAYLPCPAFLGSDEDFMTSFQIQQLGAVCLVVG